MLDQIAVANKITTLFRRSLTGLFEDFTSQI